MGVTAAIAAIGGLGVTSVVNAVKKSTSSPAAPAPAKPTPLPTQGATDEARKRALSLQRNRQGRASTILTDSDDTLG